MSTPSCSEMLKRVMLGSVMGNTPEARFSAKNGMTEPRLHITLP